MVKLEEIAPHYQTNEMIDNTNQGQQKGHHHGKITDNYP